MASPIPISRPPTPPPTTVKGSTEFHGSPLPSDVVNQVNQAIAKNPSVVVRTPSGSGGTPPKSTVNTSNALSGSSSFPSGSGGTPLSESQQAVVQGQTANIPLTIGELIQRGSTQNIQQVAQALGQKGLSSVQIQELLGGGKSYVKYGQAINTPEGQAYNKQLQEQATAQETPISELQFDFSNPVNISNAEPQFQGQETSRNFVASQHTYTVKDFNNDLLNFAKKVEDKTIVKGLGDQYQPDKEFLRQKAEELTLEALKKSNPQEVAIIRQGQEVVTEQSIFDTKYQNGIPKGSEVKYNNDLKSLNNAKDLYNALIDKSGVEYQRLPIYEQVGKRLAENIITLPLATTKFLTKPLSSSVEFAQSVIPTLEKASAGDIKSITDIGTLVILDRISSKLGFEGKGINEAQSKSLNPERISRGLEEPRIIKPKIESVSDIFTKNQVDRLIQTAHNTLGIDITNLKKTGTSTTGISIKLNDGRVFDILQVNKSSSENAPIGSQRGKVELYGFERQGKGRLYGKGVQQFNNDLSSTYSKLVVLDNIKGKARSFDILERSKNLESKGTPLKQVSTSESIARILYKKELSKQETLAINNLKNKFDKGFSIGLEELRNIINIDKRLHGETPFTNEQWKQATQGITTKSAIINLIKEIKASDQIGNVLGKTELLIKNGKVIIKGTKETASTFGGLTARRELKQVSTGIGRAVSKPEIKVVKQTKTRSLNIVKKIKQELELAKNINKLNPTGEKPIKLKAPESSSKKGINNQQLAKNINKLNQNPTPLVSTVTRALTKVEPKIRVSTPKLKVKLEFPVEISKKFPSIVQIGGKEESEFASKGVYERTEGTIFLQGKTNKILEPKTKIQFKDLVQVGSKGKLDTQFKTQVQKPELDTQFKTQVQTKVFERQGQDIQQRQVQILRQEFKQLQKEKLKEELRKKIDTRLRPREPVRPVKLTPREDPLNKNKHKESYFKKSSEGFAPVIKEKGKFIRVSNVSFKNKEQALGFGERNVFKNLNRSVAVIKTRGEKVLNSTQAQSEFNKLQGKFRPSKQYGSQVQVQRNALSTKNEINQIQEARLKAQKEQFKRKVGSPKIRSIF